MSLFDQAGWPESRPFWQHFQFYELPKDPWDWTAEDVVRALCEEPLVIMVLPSMKRKQWNVNVHAFAEFVNRKQINGRALLTSVGLDNLKGGFGIEDREAATNVMNVILELRQLSPGCMKIIREGRQFTGLEYLDVAFPLQPPLYDQQPQVDDDFLPMSQLPPPHIPNPEEQSPLREQPSAIELPTRPNVVKAEIQKEDLGQQSPIYSLPVHDDLNQLQILHSNHQAVLRDVTSIQSVHKAIRLGVADSEHRPPPPSPLSFEDEIKDDLYDAFEPPKPNKRKRTGGSTPTRSPKRQLEHGSQNVTFTEPNTQASVRHYAKINKALHINDSRVLFHRPQPQGHTRRKNVKNDHGSSSSSRELSLAGSDGAGSPLVKDRTDQS